MPSNSQRSLNPPRTTTRCSRRCTGTPSLSGGRRRSLALARSSPSDCSNPVYPTKTVFPLRPELRATGDGASDWREILGSPDFAYEYHPEFVEYYTETIPNMCKVTQ